MQNSRHWHCNGTICCKRPQSSTESSIDPSCIWCLVVCNLHSPAKVNNSINIWYIISAWHLAVVTPGTTSHNITQGQCHVCCQPHQLSSTGHSDAVCGVRVRCSMTQEQAEAFLYFLRKAHCVLLTMGVAIYVSWDPTHIQLEYMDIPITSLTYLVKH